MVDFKICFLQVNKATFMTPTTAVIGLRAGKSLMGSSACYSDAGEKLSCSNDLGFMFVPNKNTINAKSTKHGNGLISNQITHRAPKGHVNTGFEPSNIDRWVQRFVHLEEEEGSECDFSVEALLSLHKSMLEKQWNLSIERTITSPVPAEKSRETLHVTGSGTSARRRRIDAQKKTPERSCLGEQFDANLRSVISPKTVQNCGKGYVSDALLTHSEVAALSKRIKTGQRLEEQKSRLTERFGSEPSDGQIATSMRISRADLQIRQIECTLAREKLAMSNVRLVRSIAQRYDNMGADIADLTQGGLIGLLRGIENYDPSRGFKISTYVYWWIRQGVSRALIESSRTLRLPTHLHERLGAIRNAKARLAEKGITPSIDRIAETLKISSKKVRNATEAISKVFSLDREAFPSLNGLPGDTVHSYIADNRLENNPWHGVDEGTLKDEVNKLINTTLSERERDIVRLYYGLDNECLTWEDISRRIGLSRERVRQLGLVALEKLRQAARETKLESLLL